MLERTPVLDQQRDLLPLVLGNTKLGEHEIYQFSIPEGDTCVCKSEVCKKICNVQRGFYRFATTQHYLWLRDQMRWEPDFVQRVVGQIKLNRIRTVRIHVSGDFDRVPYVRKWIEIVTACPRTEFYSYTRSWNSKRLYPALCQLASLPNYSMWWSCDKSMPEPPKNVYARRAYLAVNDDDQPPYSVDLVFRDKPKTAMLRMGDGLVCPEERKKHFRTGPAASKIKCENCRLCWGDYFERIDRLNADARGRSQKNKNAG